MLAFLGPRDAGPRGNIAGLSTVVDEDAPVTAELVINPRVEGPLYVLITLAVVEDPAAFLSVVVVALEKNKTD